MTNGELKRNHSQIIAVPLPGFTVDMTTGQKLRHADGHITRRNALRAQVQRAASAAELGW
jgi:hypothetical protein